MAPTAVRIKLLRTKLFLLISSSSVFIKREVSIELMIRATNKDELNTTESVMGK